MTAPAGRMSALNRIEAMGLVELERDGSMIGHRLTVRGEQFQRFGLLEHVMPWELVYIAMKESYP